MKKYIFICVIILSCVYILFIKFGGANENETKIGALLALTGSHAFYSEDALRGLRLAEKDNVNINKSKVVLMVENTEGNPAKAASAATKLINQDKVDGLITFSGASAALAVAPISNKNKTPQIELICYAPGCHTKDDYLFRVSGQAQTEPYFIADEIISQKKTRVVVLYAQNDFGKSMSRFFAERFTQKNGRILATDSFLQVEQDFRTQIAKIKTLKDIDYIVFLGFGEIKHFMKQAHELKLDIKVFAAETADDPEIIKIAGKDAVRNLQYSFPGDSNRSEYINFKDRYLNEYGFEPSYAAFKAYDAYNILVRSINSCLTKNKECTKLILKTTDYSGVSAHIKFDDHGDSSGETFHLKRMGM